MEVVVESSESGRVVGIAMDFPAGDSKVSCLPPRVPPGLRRRLSECKTTSPPSIEEIEAKLRGADLRRQKFYENLSSRARPKPRSPSKPLSLLEDLGERLEARLQAAEQKRLSILEKSQTRLAKLDELRQAAKTEVEMRLQKERVELGSRVESRFQQAAANRMLILKAYKQKRATLKERTSQTLLKRITRESRYKECVRAAISQKRAAAEKKRLGLLEEEQRRAAARVLKVWKISKSVSDQRETESRRMKDKLEDKLQRAKRQRAEYLMQKGKLNFSMRCSSKMMHNQADFLSKKLARCWRQFLKLNRTSFELAKAYDGLNINEKMVKSMPFDQLALTIQSATTLQTTKSLLDRLESRYKLCLVSSSCISDWDDIDHLLRRVASPNRRATQRKSTQIKDLKTPTPRREAKKALIKLSRYQARIVLSAYMILGHPDAVLSDQGGNETTLKMSAEKFIQEFELLIKIMLDGSLQNHVQEFDSALSKRLTFRSQLAAFDAGWCSYLNSFVAWKVKDAQSLEGDLIRACCQLELSMIQTCKLTREGESSFLTHDMKAVRKQVTEDQKLLRQKVLHLSGDSGIHRLESALADTRIKYFQEIENGSLIRSPVKETCFLGVSSSLPSLSSGVSRERSNVTVNSKRSGLIIRSLFKDDTLAQPREVDFSTPGRSPDGEFLRSDNFCKENEFIVNELVHGQQFTFSDSSNKSEGQNSIESRVREAMEKAFWDEITESMEKGEANDDRIVDLIKDVRDGICELAPLSWRQEVFGAIDLEILSQLMHSGKLDMDYLGNILEFALLTLRKLSAPANENELKASHQKYLEELSEMCQTPTGSNVLHSAVLIQGLQFVLEQIQALKREISTARLRMLEPLLNSPAGLEYLGKAFTNCYGPPSNASVALPLTVQWLLSLKESIEEWNEHCKDVSELVKNCDSFPLRSIPSSTLRTGGNFCVKSNGKQVQPVTAEGADHHYSECKGEKIDLFVRLGLLKLVCGVFGLTQEELPETLKLNLSRLRAVQAQIQKIIVLATSILVLFQTLLSEQMIHNPMELDNLALNCVNQISGLLDTNQNAGAAEIIEILSKVTADGDSEFTDARKVQSRKDIMLRMLTKSLRDGDKVFVRVSRAVYLAARGLLLGGVGPTGRKLAESVLQQVGAAVLIDMVVEAASILVVAASVSYNVHGPWYANLVDNM